MFELTGDEVPCDVGKRIRAVVVEEAVLLTGPQRHMQMEARAVLRLRRTRHEGSDVPVGLCDLLDGKAMEEGPVRGLGCDGVRDVDFELATRTLDRPRLNRNPEGLEILPQ